MLVGSSIRRLRQERRLSAAELSRRADVSRRMLSGIESGTANASLVTLDKIARTLGVDFSALVRPRSDGAVEVMTSDEATVVWSGRAPGSEGRVFVTSRSIGPSEMWDWTLGPHDRYDAEPDPTASEEILSVTDGVLTLESGSRRYIVPRGSVVRLSSDRLYSYVNDGARPVRFQRVVVINTQPSSDIDAAPGR